MSIRERLVALAESYVDVGMSTDPDRFLGLVAAGESATIRAYMGQPKTSSCALVVRGLWREAGLVHKRLAPPYKIGMAVADVASIARERGGYVDVSPKASMGLVLPSPGDVVLVGGGPTYGGAEHVYTVVEADLALGGQAVRLVTIDGGQRDPKGNQIIRRRERWWTRTALGISDRARAGTSPGGGDPGASNARTVRCVFDVGRIFGDDDPASLEAA